MEFLVKSKSQAMPIISDNNSDITSRFISIIDSSFNQRLTAIKPAQQHSKKNLFSTLLRNPYFLIILIAFTIRLTTMGLYPIGDTTEARYSEIARKMVETGNWIMPQYENGEPFWGKPPLSIWLQAITFKMFGYGEFAARLSTLIVSLLTVMLVFSFTKQQLGRGVAWIATTLLTTNTLFYLLSGAVLMDPLLTLGTTLSMIAFWHVIKDRGRHWGYWFFVGISIGLMAKGPVAGVLITLPIIIWLSLSSNWITAWQRLPVFSGTLLMLTLTLPWYILAEKTTPGFLEYYIIGEHWERFTTAGWQGNRYGSTHSSYMGAIWVEWLIAAFPMSLILITALVSVIWNKKYSALSILSEPWSLYLILWTSALMLFFTFSGNVITTYVQPALPATAILVAGLWLIKPLKTNSGKKQTRKSIAVITIAGVLIPLIYLAVVLFHMPKVANHNSEKFLINKFNSIENSKNARLIYLYILPSSAEFYSRGKTEVIHSTAEIRGNVIISKNVFFAIPVDYMADITDKMKLCLNKIDRYGRYILFKGNQQNCKT